MSDDETGAVERRRDRGQQSIPDSGSTVDFDRPIEPGSPTVENALFVLLGIVAALAVVFRLIQLFG